MVADFKKMPLVSVIVRTCPWRRHLLMRCLKSINAQEYRKIEIVVVEDGSGETRLDVDHFRASTDLAVQYQSIPKGGRCRAGNRGLESANGALLNFLDDDDEFYPNHVSSLVEVLCKRPDLVAAYSRALEVPASIRSFDPLIVIDHPGRPFREQAFSFAQLCYRNFLPIQSVMFRHELFRQFGGFDVQLDQLEDWNLWTRYFSAGEPDFVDKVTSFFRVPASSTEQLRRNSAIDRYFPVALQKQRQLLAEIGRGDIVRKIQEIELDRMLLRSGLSRWIKVHPMTQAATIRVLNLLRRCVKFVRRRLATAVSANLDVPYTATSGPIWQRIANDAPSAIPPDANSSCAAPRITTL
jgi:glycosyltransferase involved in cell wall biosynthesis